MQPHDDATRAPSSWDDLPANTFSTPVLPYYPEGATAGCPPSELLALTTSALLTLSQSPTREPRSILLCSRGGAAGAGGRGSRGGAAGAWARAAGGPLGLDLVVGGSAGARGFPCCQRLRRLLRDRILRLILRLLGQHHHRAGLRSLLLAWLRRLRHRHLVEGRHGEKQRAADLNRKRLRSKREPGAGPAGQMMHPPEQLMH